MTGRVTVDRADLEAVLDVAAENIDRHGKEAREALASVRVASFGLDDPDYNAESDLCDTVAHALANAPIERGGSDCDDLAMAAICAIHDEGRLVPEGGRVLTAEQADHMAGAIRRMWDDRLWTERVCNDLLDALGADR